MRDRILNLVLYQAGWFAMVLGAGGGHPWSGSAAGLALLGTHVALAAEPLPEVRTVLAFGILGTAVDSLQALAGVFVFESGYWSTIVVPLWLTVMWMQFATLFHFVLDWLSGRYLLSSVLGAVGGPAAYFTGERLGAVVFPMGTGRSLVIMAMTWALVMPACVTLAGRFRPRTGRGRYRLSARRPSGGAVR